MSRSLAKRVDTVVFDLGNVVIGWDPFRPFSSRMSRREWEEFTQEVDFFGLNGLADAGMPLAEVVALADKRHPEHGDLVRTYYQDFEQSLTGPIPGTAEIIEDLDSGGFRLLGLTNWSTETFATAPVAAPAINRLESVMISSREGVAKPDSEIFRRLVSRYLLQPQQTVFIDDSAANVEAAQTMGLVALQFVGAEQLRHDLAQLSIMS